MRANAAEYSITELCRIVEINPATYYRSVKQSSSTPTAGAEEQAVAAVFAEHSRRYGARRIHAELCARGICIGRHRVGRVMRERGLRAIQPKSFVPRTTDSKHRLGYSENLLLAAQVAAASSADGAGLGHHLFADANGWLQLLNNVDGFVLASHFGMGSWGADERGFTALGNQNDV